MFIEHMDHLFEVPYVKCLDVSPEMFMSLPLILSHQIQPSAIQKRPHIE